MRLTSAEAKDKIMLVRSEPATFGHFRLIALASYYPDLSKFISTQGPPDFLAETSKGSDSYFVLYYLEKRQAFASRGNYQNPRTVEFAGPYPITAKEYKTLKSIADSPL